MVVRDCKVFKVLGGFVVRYLTLVGDRKVFLKFEREAVNSSTK